MCGSTEAYMPKCPRANVGFWCVHQSMKYDRHSLCEWHMLYKEKYNIITWLLLKVMFGWWTKIRACLWRIVWLAPTRLSPATADSLMFCVLLVSAVWKVDSSEEYKKYQIVTKVWRKTITACFPVYIKAQFSAPIAFFYLCLPLTPSIHTNVALWPHCSTVSVEQLGSVRSPFSLPPHTHTITEWGRLLSLARCSVEVVIESFDQNIGGAVKRPVLAHAAALCLSIRLGWSSSCWV